MEPAPPPPDQPAQYDGIPSNSSSAMTAMVVGIVSLFVFGVVLGPLAIYLGRRAQAEIDESGGALTGVGRAKAAQILGAVAFIIWTIGVVINLAVRS